LGYNSVSDLPGKDGFMPTQLVEALQERIDSDGLRAVARGIRISPSTLYSILDGHDFQERTLEKLASYLALPPTEVFRMAHNEPGDAPNDAIYDALRLIASMMSLLPDYIQAELIEHFKNMIQTKIRFYEKFRNDRQ
jgi:hypothetical protein